LLAGGFMGYLAGKDRRRPRRRAAELFCRHPWLRNGQLRCEQFGGLLPHADS
jgi:hypothetical protein